MAIALLEKPAPTRSGLTTDELGSISERDRRLVAAWIRAKSGGEDSAPFIPNAIRRLTLETRLELATDPAADVAFEELERRRVGRDHAYFTEAYGHLQPPVGPPVPFDLWPEQRRVAELLRVHRLVIALKARQLGLTWLALHDAFHLLAFDTATPNARVLALSKHGGDASKLILRVRKIRELLPPFLRPEEASDTRRALSRFGLVGRGEMVSLAGTPDAARMETATLAILDEFGFMRNRNAGPTLTAVLPTLGQTGRLVIVSTGNGPAEAPGDGQALAVQWQRARAGESGIFPVFLPASTDPARRSAKWRREARAAFDTIEEFEAEHPETEEQALRGRPGSKVYPPAGINAAEQLGRLFDLLANRDELPPPAPVKIPNGPTVRGVGVGIDWGEQTVGLPIYPLEAGGIFVPRGEIVHSHREPSELAVPLLRRALELGPLADARFDAAGVQSMRTFAATARAKVAPRLRTTSIPFGTYKAETIGYLRRLFNRTAAIVRVRELLRDRDFVKPELEDALGLELDPDDRELLFPIARLRTNNFEPGENPLEELLELVAEGEEELVLRADDFALVRVIAISPANVELLRQLRGLEFADDDSGKVEKGDDHAPDALVAGGAPIAARHRAG